MTVVATASNPRFTVSRVDIDRGGPTYTVDTLRDLARHLPDAELYFITGADALEPDPVLAPGARDVRARPLRRRHPPGFDLDADHLPDAAAGRACIEVPAMAISSTECRARVEPRRAGLVPRARRGGAVHRQARPLPRRRGAVAPRVPELMAVQPELVVPDDAAWRAWLLANHADPTGVWLLLAKKAALAVPDPPTTLTYAQALDEALCFGWIDGQAKRRDDGTYSAAVHPAPGAVHLVGAQHGVHRPADRRGPDAPRGVRGGRAGAGRTAGGTPPTPVPRRPRFPTISRSPWRRPRRPRRRSTA